MTHQRKCKRCGNKFHYNPIIVGDDVCDTCERMNCISFWYPKLYRLNFPTPETIIIHTNLHWEELERKEITKNVDNFLYEITQAIIKIGIPAFLRTGHTSNKHDWKNSCFINNIDKKYLLSHIKNLVEFSSVATIDRFMPCDFWAVRKFIKTKSYFTAFFGDMPITKERRYFINNGKIQCHHSYWPKEAFEKIDKKVFKELSELSKSDEMVLNDMASYVAKIFTGYWSCDFLQAENGEWCLTDLAIGERSYHQKHNGTKSD